MAGSFPGSPVPSCASAHSPPASARRPCAAFTAALSPCCSPASHSPRPSLPPMGQLTHWGARCWLLAVRWNPTVQRALRWIKTSVGPGNPNPSGIFPFHPLLRLSRVWRLQRRPAPAGTPPATGDPHMVGFPHPPLMSLLFPIYPTVRVAMQRRVGTVAGPFTSARVPLAVWSRCPLPRGVVLLPRASNRCP
jgi:hypothetical protein